MAKAEQVLIKRDTKSIHEDQFFQMIVADGILPVPVRQHIFAEPRKWKADFAWLKEKVIVEIEGGTFNKGRHVQGPGFEKDCEKYNTATALGWKVLRFTPNMIYDESAMRMLKWIFRV